jgi:hypothetical protein
LRFFGHGHRLAQRLADHHPDRGVQGDATRRCGSWRRFFPPGSGAVRAGWHRCRHRGRSMR